MTEQLEKAVQYLKNLPPDQQDAIAALIFEELEDDAKWDDSFAKTKKLLEQLADEAEEERVPRARRCEATAALDKIIL